MLEDFTLVESQNKFKSVERIASLVSHTYTVTFTYTQLLPQTDGSQIQLFKKYEIERQMDKKLQNLFVANVY